MKIAIFHDFLIEKGGGERVIKTVCKNFDSKIFTCFYYPDKTYPEFKDFEIIYSKCLLNRLLIKNRLFKILRAYYYFSEQLKRLARYINKNFDVALFSGFYSIYFSKYVEIPKVYYIQSEPFSMVFEREGIREKEGKFLKPILAKIYKMEKESLEKMDIIIANSRYTKEIYETTYNLKVDEVIYPPVNIEGFYFKKLGDFYLYVGRLYPHKRVHIVVKAFEKMKDHKLVIVGDGPLRNFVRSVANKCKNISYLGSVDDKTLKELYATTRGVIYISEKEHFGIVPVEANAAGKPVIVSNEGGLKEIVNRDEVGIRIREPYLENLIEVIQNEKHIKYWDKRYCIKNAKRFGENIFIEKLSDVLKKVN